jgi:redox-sensitive bicupin YhaK (pirin superfamily)
MKPEERTMIMTSTQLTSIIPSRERDLGGFQVRRILPAIGRKMVGPFIFLDHMGPAEFSPGQGMDVRPHPHINLATVTYLFEGAIFHRDSLGFAQVIRPGDINWMTAGSGIVHSERTPQELRDKGSRINGIQCWVALPVSHEETEPTFQHHPEASLPSFSVNGVQVRLLLGDAFGHRSPVRVFSDIIYLEVQLPAGKELIVPAGQRELGVYPAQGSIQVNNQVLPQGSLGIGGVGVHLHLRAESTSRLMVIGGEPFAEGREIWWNFVSSSTARIEKAKMDWAAGRFPKVPGDEEEFIPLPEEYPAPARPAGTIL